MKSRLNILLFSGIFLNTLIASTAAFACAVNGLSSVFCEKTQSLNVAGIPGALILSGDDDGCDDGPAWMPAISDDDGCDDNPAWHPANPGLVVLSNGGMSFWPIDQRTSDQIAKFYGQRNGSISSLDVSNQHQSRRGQFRVPAANPNSLSEVGRQYDTLIRGILDQSLDTSHPSNGLIRRLAERSSDSCWMCRGMRNGENVTFFVLREN